jgi:cytoskeleton protein RodZ
MAEIGETLREARMRRRIDMTEVEAATKIRAKYLRALENEEWDLLPGPTFVKTFLRTYAEYLELDPRMLVEEYRQRYERPSTQDLTPFGPGMGGRRRQRPRRSLGPLFVLLAGVVVLLGALYLLGVVWGDTPEKEAPPVVSTATPTATATATKSTRPKKKSRKRAAPKRASLRLTAKSARVYVCLVDATGKAVVNGEYLEPGKSTKTFRSQRFRVNLGNSAVTLRVGGKRYAAENTGKPIGYDVRPGKKPTRLSEAARLKLKCSA